MRRAEDFRLFVEPEIPTLLRVARSLAGNSQDAEDLVQETLIKAFQGLHNFDGAYPRAWLFTIMSRRSRAEAKIRKTFVKAREDAVSSVRSSQFKPVKS